MTAALSLDHHSGDLAPQPNSLSASTQTSLLVKVFSPFPYILDWLPRSIFQPLPASDKNVQQDRHSVGICNRKTSHLIPLTFSASTENLNLKLSALRLFSELLEKSPPRQIIPVIRKHRWSNTESPSTSVFKDPVSESYSRTDLTDAVLNLTFDRSAVGYLNQLVYRWLSLTGIPIPSINVATVANSRSPSHRDVFYTIPTWLAWIS